MPDSAKNEPMTRFLMYKVAIRIGQIEAASECLEAIASAATNDPSLLYACCLHSMEGNDKRMTLAALQVVLEKFNYGPPMPVHLPSLLRITIGLVSSLLEQPQNENRGDDREALVEKLCKLFEGGIVDFHGEKTS